MQNKDNLNSPEKLSGVLRKLAALIVAVSLIGLVLMFSAVLFAIILLVGTIAWVYLWWKTRELRKMMRDFPTRKAEREGEIVSGEVIEGEVVRIEIPGDRN